jgi:transcriptional regulator with XRE-family HTH domain
MATPYLTAPQLRAARALLNWSQADLADKAGVSVETVKRLERVAEGADPLTGLRAVNTTLDALERALGEGGVQLIEADREGGPGVRFRPLVR